MSPQVTLHTYFFLLQHVDLDNSYLCGYLKIKGLTEEYPTVSTITDELFRYVDPCLI